MSEDRIEMSQAERDRLKVLAPVLEGRRTQVEAARLLELTERQIRRIVRRVEAEGDKGVIHRLRGRPSNRRSDGNHRRRVLEAYRRELAGFGPTFAAEKLAVRGLAVGRETLRRWLVAEGLWKRMRRRDRHRSRRERRACFGELVQADGSHHDWLEGRGPRMSSARPCRQRGCVDAQTAWTAKTAPTVMLSRNVSGRKTFTPCPPKLGRRAAVSAGR